MPRLSPTFTPDGSLGGRYQIPCAPKRRRCKPLTRRSCVLRKQQVSFTIRITARSMSALSTTSVLPSTGFAAFTGTVGDSYDNTPGESVRSSYNNELIRTRTWDVSSRWKLPRVNGCHGETRLRSTRAWNIDPLQRLKPNFGRRTRHRENRNQGKCLGTKLGKLQSCGR